MRSIGLIFLFLALWHPLWSQKKLNKVEYSGSKQRITYLGNSKMFTEGVKPVEFSIFLNKKKRFVKIQSGPKEKWYLIRLTGKDTIQGDIVETGYLENKEINHPDKIQSPIPCFVHFHMDKVVIKLEGLRVEEYLIDGATVWGGKKIKRSK